MRHIAAILTLGLAVAACGDGGGETEQPAGMAIGTENPGSDQLKKLSPTMRKLGLYRAVRDSGLRCKRIDAGAYQQEHKNMAMWVARCSDTGDVAVFIGANGDVQVRRCGQAAELGLPECKPIPEEAESPEGNMSAEGNAAAAS